jgi:hypothetical protein
VAPEAVSDPPAAVATFGANANTRVATKATDSVADRVPFRVARVRDEVTAILSLEVPADRGRRGHDCV